MSFNRPLIPYWYDDAHQSQVIDSANDNNLIAGRGITLTKTTFGTTIHAKQTGAQSALNWRGTYNYSSSYAVNDVVFVDPNVTCSDQNGSVIPMFSPSGSATIPLCPGVFVCSFAIPPIGVDSDLLVDSVAPTYEAAGQQITDDFANGFRHYDLNVYYPVYPLIPSSSATYVTESRWSTIANNTFWAPLAPMFSSSLCQVDGSLVVYWVNGIQSGSVFQYQLPYTP